jgi:hydrogenase expression/formation protein HypE
VKDVIQLAHGGGGRLTRDLIEREIAGRFGDGPLKGLPDAATLPVSDRRLIFTTDSFVVQPLEFPGGNIGHLAVHGTVNDIAVTGGKPAWLSLALILEEGLRLETLRLVLDSVRSAAAECGVSVVTGDTKVVRRGQCDGMYINTAGIGYLLPGFAPDRNSVREGDWVLASGCLGDHGMAVLCARDGIRIENGPSSDTGPVHRLVEAATPWAGSVRFMRDPTRGGAAAVLNEIVGGTAFGIALSETDLPFSPGAKAVAELLGLDPLHVASEGRMLMVCSPGAGKPILEEWRRLPAGREARKIGAVTSDAGRVILSTVTGGRRLVDVPHGDLLPRIC